MLINWLKLTKLEIAIDFFEKGDYYKSVLGHT